MQRRDSRPGPVIAMGGSGTAIEDADQLFVNYSVAEVRHLHNRTSSDIERKKQDLRLMVGEQYRDLIDAADAIKMMHESAVSASSTLEAIEENCNASVLMDEVMVQRRKEKDSMLEQRKLNVYSVAAQIKLLVDTPEQIWHAMEGHMYLKASQLYLIAAEVAENLQKYSDSGTLRPMVSFPVIRRQWNAVSHFRGQIIDRAARHLRSITENDKNIASTLVAIIHLRNVGVKEVLEQFLDMRKAAIHTEIQKGPSSGSTQNSSHDAVAKHICSVLALLQKSMYDTMRVFATRDERTPSAISLLLTDEGPRPEHDHNSCTIVGLYSEKTNIHALSRHLPPRIQAYKPTPVSHPQVPRSEMQGLLRKWIKSVEEILQSGLEAHLNGITTGKGLASLKREIVEFVASMETKPEAPILRIAGQTDRADVAWDELCNVFLLGKSYSLWTNIVRPTLNHRAEEIIHLSFESLKTQPQAMLRKQLSTLGSATTTDRCVGDYIWKSDHNTSSGFDLEADFTRRVETPALTDVCESFDQTLQAIRSDTDPLLLPASQEAGSDFFGATDDAMMLFRTYRKAFVETVMQYSGALLEMVKETEVTGLVADQDLKARALQIDQCLFTGRVARTIAMRLRKLNRSFSLDNNWAADEAYTQSKNPGRSPLLVAALEEFGIEVMGLQTRLLEVYDAAHGIWVKLIAERLESTVLAELKRQAWEDHLLTRIWEPVDTSVNPESAIRYPVHASASVVITLFDLCSEWNRVAGFSLEKSSLIRLRHEIGARFVSVYARVAIQKDLSSIQAVQLLFDFLYVGKVFGHETFGQEGIARDVVQTLLTKGGPAADANLMSVTATRVQNFHLRTSALFGAFLVAPTAPLSKNISQPSQESPFVVPTAEQPPRYTLLPVITLPPKRQASASDMSLSTAEATAPPPPPRRVSLVPVESAPSATHHRVKPKASIRLYGPTQARPTHAATSGDQRQSASATTPLGGTGNKAPNIGSVLGMVSSQATSFLSGVLDLGSPTVGRRKH
ncbi:hypothetical protein DFS34DRAFT_604511 [Phlyctochytrium arcticum]|nr:hypothetical protein DFS34DRAFT_604511 [Phlyctochytrium arcticum]